MIVRQYCYCRQKHYCPHDDPADFAYVIQVKEYAPDLLRCALSRLPVDVVCTGDYQAAERKFGLSRKMLEVCWSWDCLCRSRSAPRSCYPTSTSRRAASWGLLQFQRVLPAKESLLHRRALRGVNGTHTEGAYGAMLFSAAIAAGRRVAQGKVLLDRLAQAQFA